MNPLPGVLACNQVIADQIADDRVWRLVDTGAARITERRATSPPCAGRDARSTGIHRTFRSGSDLGARRLAPLAEWFSLHRSGGRLIGDKNLTRHKPSESPTPCSNGFEGFPAHEGMVSDSSSSRGKPWTAGTGLESGPSRPKQGRHDGAFALVPMNLTEGEFDYESATESNVRPRSGNPIRADSGSHHWSTRDDRLE